MVFPSPDKAKNLWKSPGDSRYPDGGFPGPASYLVCPCGLKGCLYLEESRFSRSCQGNALGSTGESVFL